MKIIRCSLLLMKVVSSGSLTAKARFTAALKTVACLNSFPVVFTASAAVIILKVLTHISMLKRMKRYFLLTHQSIRQTPLLFCLLIVRIFPLAILNISERTAMWANITCTIMKQRNTFLKTATLAF